MLDIYKQDLVDSPYKESKMGELTAWAAWFVLSKSLGLWEAFLYFLSSFAVYMNSLFFFNLRNPNQKVYVHVSVYVHVHMYVCVCVLVYLCSYNKIPSTKFVNNRNELVTNLEREKE